MNKDDWYVNRILWRANKHKLFDNRCCKYSELSAHCAAVIEQRLPEMEKPVLVFWDSEQKWTLLCALQIYSFMDGQLIFANLDDINESMKVPQSSDSIEDLKRNAGTLLLDKLNRSIWVPDEAELFALWSILQMFSLKYSWDLGL